MSYMEYHKLYGGDFSPVPTLIERDHATIRGTLEAIIEHLKETEPNRTLTARKLINHALLEAETCQM